MQSLRPRPMPAAPQSVFEQDSSEIICTFRSKSYGLEHLFPPAPFRSKTGKLKLRQGQRLVQSHTASWQPSRTLCSSVLYQSKQRASRIMLSTSKLTIPSYLAELDGCLHSILVISKKTPIQKIKSFPLQSGKPSELRVRRVT